MDDPSSSDALGNNGDADLDVSTYPADAYIIVNGGFGAKQSGTEPMGTTTWLDYAAEELPLPAAQSNERTVTLTVQQETESDQYITGLVLENAEPVEGSGDVAANQIVRQVLPITVQVPGKLNPAFEFGEAGHQQTAGRSAVGVEIDNTGNTHIGYRSATDDQLKDAVGVLDAFHLVKLGTQAVDEVRHRIQQQTLGRGDHKGDPLYGIQRTLQAGAEHLIDRQADRITTAIRADPAHEEDYLAWQYAQDLRAAYQAQDLTKGRKIAEKVLATFQTCPVPEIDRLGRTLRRWRDSLLAYFTTNRSSNGSTEATINGIIELHRRLARGYRNRDNYRLRMLLVAGDLTA